MTDQIEIFGVVFFLGLCAVAGIRYWTTPSWAEFWIAARPKQKDPKND